MKHDVLGHIPALPALRHPLVEACLTTRIQELQEIVERYGRPVHVLLPEIAKERLRAMQSVLQDRGLAFQIHYAAKVNRSDIFIAAALETGCGIDLASYEEFTAALSQGAAGEDLCLSGPFKCDRALTLAARSGALVTVDSLEELQRLIDMDFGGRGPCRVLLRWSGVTTRISRFGLTRDQITEAIVRCKATANISLHGLSFHLGGYDIEERAVSLEDSVSIIAEHSDAFAVPRIVNIGGGLPIRYAAKETWEVAKHLTASAFWPGKRAGSIYPCCQDVVGDQALAAILDCPSRVVANTSIADFVRNSGVKVLVEPGRAALDQAAFSMFPVASTKRLSEVRQTVCLKGNSLSLSERWFDCEVMTDPVLLSALGEERTAEPTHACLLHGASCLEDDVFSWRWINFPRDPVQGDVIAFVNTAPYQMDFAETAIHRAELPARIVLSDAENFEWCPA